MPSIEQSTAWSTENISSSAKAQMPILRNFFAVPSENALSVKIREQMSFSSMSAARYGTAQT